MWNGEWRFYIIIEYNGNIFIKRPPSWLLKARDRRTERLEGDLDEDWDPSPPKLIYKINDYRKIQQQQGHWGHQHAAAVRYKSEGLSLKEVTAETLAVEAAPPQNERRQLMMISLHGSSEAAQQQQKGILTAIASAGDRTGGIE